MASQILHEIVDDIENAWAKIRGIKPQVDAEMRTALDNARQHAEKLVDDVAEDVRTDGGAIVTDVESGVHDVVQTGEAALSGDTSQPDSAAPQSAPAEQSDTQPAA